MKKLFQQFTMVAAATTLMTVGMTVARTQTAEAASVSFSYSSKWNTDREVGFGEFEGVDINEDGLLKLDELTSFYSLFSQSEEINLEDLSGFGSFDLGTGIWNADGLSWSWSTNNAYFNWDNRRKTVGSTWAAINVTNYTPDVKDVPEPTTILGLFAVGGAAVVSRRKKQAAK